MEKKFIAVMHVKPSEPVKVSGLCTRVIGKLTDNVADYSAPEIAVSVLTTENNKLIPLIAQAKGNTQKKDERDEQTIVVFDLLTKECIYVNSVANGNKVLIDKSGFDAAKEAEPHGIPGTPVIKKVEDGEVPKSAKILLVRPLPKGLRYNVQLLNLEKSGTDPLTLTKADAGEDFDIDGLPWVIVLDSVSSTELLLTDLKRGKEIAIRVQAEDRSKKSGWSDPYLFMAR